MKIVSIIWAAALTSLSAAQIQSVQTDFTTVIGATSAAPVPAPSGTDVPPPVKGVCGQGYTYCGYILRDHQGFEPTDIVKAYCAGNKDNCANGKTKSDPLQALYVCVPGNSTPPPPPPRPSLRMEHHDHDKMMGGSGMMGKDMRKGMSKGMDMGMDMGMDTGMDMNMDMDMAMNGPHLHQRQAPVPAPAPPSPSGGGGSCSLPTTGNRLVLLCTCTAGNSTCLNPDADHIGRCDTPCSS